MPLLRRPVDGALFCTAKGFKVFPLLPNQKEPEFQGWQDWARASNPSKIELKAKANPTLNWGVFCDNDLLIIDIDNKKGRNGSKTLALLEALHGKLPATLTVATTTGGQHLYFRGHGKNSAGLLGEGLDTRGEGGYVVAPASRIDDKMYEVTNDADVADAPEWLLKLLAEKKREPEVITAPVIEGRRNEILTSLAGTMRRRGVNYEGILAALEAVNQQQVENPLPYSEVEQIARSICRYTPEQAKVASDFLDTPDVLLRDASDINPAHIPARHWIMENRYMAGFLSVIISPGGVGKSMLTMLDGIAVATGRKLTGFDVIDPSPVWIYNTEDPMDELDRRIAAIAQYYDLPLKLLKDRLFVSSGQDHPFIVAKMGQDGVVINQEALDNTVRIIREKGIKLFIADPFVRTHECMENDNMQMDKVAWCFQRIAVRTGCAVGLVHHTSKAGSREAPGEMNSGRGATALVYASRIAHTINTMTDKEANKFGVSIERRRWYFRFDNAKANMQPPADRADWFERKSVILPNQDSVGTVERVSMKDLQKSKEKDQAKAELSDMAACLFELLKPGDSYPTDDVVTLIIASPKYSHLFEGYNLKYSRDKLIQILNRQDFITFKNKRFYADYDPCRRPKYVVNCEEYDVNKALENALE